VQPVASSAPTSHPAAGVYPEPRRSPVLPMLAAAVVLIGLIGVLVARTPVGVALGLRKPNTGSVEIHTSPSLPASVEIDGVFRGQAPVRVDGIAVGAHQIAANAEGYAPASSSVVVEGGEVAQLVLSLVKEPPPAPEPTAVADATAAAANGGGEEDEADEDEAANTDDRRSAPRKVRKRRKARPSEPEAAEPSVAPGTPGKLVVSSVPWARVFVDGQDTGRNTPLLGLDLPPGPHEIGLQTQDGRTHVRRVNVKPGQVVRIRQRF
jgi:hypothetical protein